MTKVPYTNTIDLMDRLEAYIDRKNAQLEGSGIRLVLADDQTVATRNAIHMMQNNAMLWPGAGAAGVLGVSGPAYCGDGDAGHSVLNCRHVVGAIATGNTLNVSVLLGIVIVLGMLVDDAVVVVEAMYYRLQRGMACPACGP